MSEPSEEGTQLLAVAVALLRDELEAEGARVGDIAVQPYEDSDHYAVYRGETLKDAAAADAFLTAREWMRYLNSRSEENLIASGGRAPDETTAEPEVGIQ